MITVNKDTNTIEFTFIYNEPFNENLLADAADNFKQLNQKDLNILCNGFMPLELCIYLGEVAKHCEMNVTFKDDKQSKEFLEFIAKKDMIKINFKD